MKKKFTITLLLLSFCLLNNFLYAQKSKFKKTIRGEFQLPRATWNKAFTKTFSGVFNSGISLNFGTKHFSVGPFYSLTQYQVFPRLFDDPHVIQTNHTGGLVFHLDKLTETGNGMWSAFIMPGYSWIKYSRILCKDNGHPPYQPQSSAKSINIGGSYTMMLDEWVGVGFIVGFNMVDHVFYPENVCLDQWQSYDTDDYKGDLKNIFFGFNFYFDLAYKAPTASEE
ncbi:MAG: hypothetical protein HY063_14705 [Bacteroidetes bacterium]|nr:hypothetical protein [Bacteroidota bacterium]